MGNIPFENDPAFGTGEPPEPRIVNAAKVLSRTAGLPTIEQVELSGPTQLVDHSAPPDDMAAHYYG